MSEMMMAAAAAMANQNPQAMEQYFESLKMKQLAEAGMLANVTPSLQQQQGQKVNNLNQGYHQPKASTNIAQKHSKKRKFKNIFNN